MTQAPHRKLAPTPGQTLGPFYGYALPFDKGNELVTQAHPGSLAGGFGQPPAVGVRLGDGGACFGQRGRALVGGRGGSGAGGSAANSVRPPRVMPMPNSTYYTSATNQQQGVPMPSAFPPLGMNDPMGPQSPV